MMKRVPGLILVALLLILIVPATTPVHVAQAGLAPGPVPHEFTLPPGENQPKMGSVLQQLTALGRLADWEQGHRYASRRGLALQDGQVRVVLKSKPGTAETETTISLQQGSNGYSGCNDTHIYQYAPDANYCGAHQLRVGYKQQYAALLRLDLSAIPPNATVTQASLQLYATGWSGANITVSAYAMAREFSACQATWNQAQSGNPWGQPGCNDTATDRRASPESSFTTHGSNKWYDLDLTTAVQDWVSGGLTNKGLLLRGSLSLSKASFYFASAQHGTIHFHPKLIITYLTTGNPTPTLTATVPGLLQSHPTVLQGHRRTSGRGSPVRDRESRGGSHAAGSFESIAFMTVVATVPAASATPTHTATATSSPTPTSTPANSPTPTATRTPTPAGPTASPTPTSASSETTITLQQGSNGYFDCNDTYIYQYAPETSYCWNDQLKVGYKQQNAALLRFNLSSIAPEATITQATLQLYATGWSGTNITVDAYVITRNLRTRQATWNQSQSGNPWGQPGCNDTSTDRRASPESSRTASGINRWYDFDLTAVVQDWVSGGLANHGVLLRSASSTSRTSFYFASAQRGDLYRRPRIVITYRTGPAPTPGTAPTLIIGHITDAHIGGQDGSDRIAASLGLISEQAQVMVDTGDCTDHGTEQESIEYMNLFNSNMSIPWRAVPGNHDTPWIFERHIGPLEWSWDVGDYRLIGINAEAINYTALDQALTHEKPCIVFGHFPLSDYTPTDRAKLRQRFKAYNVPIYIAGHTHLDSLETDPKSGTVLLTGQRAGMGHYRLITLRRFEVESISFENAWQ